MSRDSVRIALLLAELNDIDTLSKYIQGTYINLTGKEEVWFQVGAEFGSRGVWTFITDRKLNGIKSARTNGKQILHI